MTEKPLVYLEHIPNQIPYINGFKVEIIKPYILDMSDPRGFYGLFNDFDRVFKKTNVIPDQESFYYPIIISLWKFRDVANLVEIPEDVLKSVHKGQCKILVVCPYEGWDWDYWNSIGDIIKYKYAFADDSIVMLTGNYAPNNKYRSLVYNFWERGLYYSHGNDYRQGYGMAMLDSIREHKFICLNRRPTPHRYATVTLLYDIKDQGILSCAKYAGYDQRHIEYQKTDFFNIFPELKDTFTNKIDPILPLIYNDGVNPETENPATDDFNLEKFYSSYLCIVTETFFKESNCLFLSEKIFKPIVFCQPFIVVGLPGTLKLLRTLGYQTFSKYIDESYDDEENHQLRLYKAINSAKSFINKSPEELKNVMKEMEDILYHNFLVLRARSDKVFDDLRTELFEALK